MRCHDHPTLDRPAPITSPWTDLEAGTPLADATLDHVAIAVDHAEAASRWWRELGAAPLSAMEIDGFAAQQLRLANGGKVELISRGAGEEASFVDTFLQRYGSGRIHHLTLKVAGPLLDAVGRLQDAGYDVVDVRTDDPHWHESFLRPSQVGGVIVQVAWAYDSDEAFVARMGLPTPPPLDPAAPALQRVVLGHPDLDGAARLWTVLGATITVDPARPRFTARWAGAPITVEVREATTAGPIGLVLAGVDGSDRTPVAPTLLSDDSSREGHPRA